MYQGTRFDSTGNTQLSSCVKIQYTGGRSKDKANKKNTETMSRPWKECKIVSIFFASVFTTRSLVFLLRDRIQKGNNEQWKGTESRNIESYKAVRSDRMHLIACPHHCEAAPHHLQKKRIRGSPDSWRKTSSHSSQNLGDLRNNNLVSHDLVPGKTGIWQWNGLPLEAISGHRKVKKVIENSQHGYVKGIQWLKNPVPNAICDEMTTSVNVWRIVDVI